VVDTPVGLLAGPRRSYGCNGPTRQGVLRRCGSPLRLPGDFGVADVEAGFQPLTRPLWRPLYAYSSGSSSLA